MKLISTLAAAIISSLVVPGQTQIPTTSSWSISDLRVAYLYEEDRTASVAFNLSPDQGQTHYCSIAIHEIDAWMLPNVSEAYCEGEDGYLFDVTLHPPSAETEGGLNLTVYTDGLYGNRFLPLNDFQMVPVSKGRVDIKYTGVTSFPVPVYEK